MTRPRLDYVPRLDERNRAYRVAAADPALLARARWWTGGVVLDQEPGQTGDAAGYDGGGCVGHGTVGEAVASPVRVLVPGKTAAQRALAGHHLAVAVYGRCKEIDEWEGIDYEGTSVRAGMLVARERGWISGFRWAFNLLELRSALEEGPVVIGFEVYERMFDTEPDGDWIPDGPFAGGHCALVTGYSPNYAERGPRYRIRNSWGAGWGRGGNAYMTPEHLDRVLFQAGGEAAIPVGRALTPAG